MNGRKQRIEDEVTRTVQLFDELDIIEPGPHFFSGLQTKIKNRQETNRFSVRKLFQPVLLRPVFSGLLIILNLVSVSLLFQDTEYQSRIREEYITELAGEFSLTKNESDLLTTNN